MLHEFVRPGSTKSSIYRSITVQVFDYFVGVVVRLVVLFGGYSLNFVRNIGYVEISMEQLIVNVPGCVYCVSEEFRLISLDYYLV